MGYVTDLLTHYQPFISKRPDQFQQRRLITDSLHQIATSRQTCITNRPEFLLALRLEAQPAEPGVGEHQGPRAVLNALDRLSDTYRHQVETARQELAIAEGHTTRRGKPWNQVQVRRVLGRA